MAALARWRGQPIGLTRPWWWSTSWIALLGGERAGRRAAAGPEAFGSCAPPMRLVPLEGDDQALNLGPQLVGVA